MSVRARIEHLKETYWAHIANGHLEARANPDTVLLLHHLQPVPWKSLMAKASRTVGSEQRAYATRKPGD